MDIYGKVGIFIILNKAYNQFEIICSVEYYIELDNEEAYWLFDTIRIILDVLPLHYIC